MSAPKSAVSDLRAFGMARATITRAPLSDVELSQTHAFWRASLTTSWKIYSGATATRRSLSKDPRRQRCTRQWPRRWIIASTPFGLYSRKREVRV